MPDDIIRAVNRMTLEAARDPSADIHQDVVGTCDSLLEALQPKSSRRAKVQAPAWQAPSDRAAITELKKRCTEASEFVKKVKSPHESHFPTACSLMRWILPEQRKRLVALALKTMRSSDAHRAGIFYICSTASLLGDDTLTSLLACADSNETDSTVRYCIISGLLSCEQLNLPEAWLTRQVYELMRCPVDVYYDDARRIRTRPIKMPYCRLSNVPSAVRQWWLKWRFCRGQNLRDLLVCLPHLSPEDRELVVRATLEMPEEDPRKGSAIRMLADNSSHLSGDQRERLVHWIRGNPSTVDFSFRCDNDTCALTSDLEEALLEITILSPPVGLSPADSVIRRLHAVGRFSRSQSNPITFAHRREIFFSCPSDAVVDDHAALLWGHAAAALWPDLDPPERNEVKSRVVGLRAPARLKSLEGFTRSLSTFNPGDIGWIVQSAEDGIKQVDDEFTKLRFLVSVLPHLNRCDPATARRLARNVQDVHVSVWAAHGLTSELCAVLTLAPSPFKP